jgi:hypothetical protein
MFAERDQPANGGAEPSNTNSREYVLKTATRQLTGNDTTYQERASQRPLDKTIRMSADWSQNPNLVDYAQTSD